MVRFHLTHQKYAGKVQTLSTFSELSHIIYVDRHVFFAAYAVVELV